MIHQRVWREKEKVGHRDTERNRDRWRAEKKRLRLGEKTG